MPVEIRLQDLLRLGLAGPDELSPKKVAKRLAKAKIVRSYRSNTGLFLLQQQADGSCVFLGKDRLCTVYEARPDTCRGFPITLGPRAGFCPYKNKLSRK
jgi:Fe-S-cluster containining protein